MKNASELVKKTEENLQESNNLLQSIIGETTDTIFVKDLSGRYVMMNPAGANIIGKSIEEIIGKDDTQLFPHDIACKLIKEDQDIIASGNTIAFDEKIPKDGNIRIFHTVKVPYRNYRGNIIGVIGIARDITERKHMEEDLKRTTRQLSLMFESLPIIPYICKAEGNFGATYVGTEVEKVTGFKPEDFTSNDTFWADRIHPDDASRVFADIPTLFEKGHYEHEYRWQVSDNSYKWFYDVLRLVELPDKTTNQIVGIWLDITERKKAEEMLQEQKKALEQKNIALSEVLGQIELEKKQIKDNVIINAENLLLPIIQKLRLTGESRKYVQLLRKNLLELTSSFGTRLTEKGAKLTSREIEICNMVRNGLTSKEIANLLNISSLTIEKHRINIRRKLGIINKDINLTSFLKTL